MSFGMPWALLLVPLALLPILLRPRRIAVARPPGTVGAAASLRERLLPALSLLAVLAIGASVVAASRPFTGAAVRADRRYARDIALALDVSESMAGMDMKLGGRPASRLEAAVRFAEHFIGRREGDRIGIVLFGARAATQCPLTFDRQVARQLLSYVEPEMLGKRTALGDGAALGVARLAEGGALVLLSDGGQTAGRTTPQEAARAAAARGVTIYAVGVGSEGPVPVPARMPSGRTKMVTKDYPLRGEALRRLAEATGGRYLRADSAAALGRAFAAIDELEEKPKEALETVPRTRLEDGFALAAVVVLGGLMLASSTVLRAAPRLR